MSYARMYVCMYVTYDVDATEMRHVILLQSQVTRARQVHNISQLLPPCLGSPHMVGLSPDHPSTNPEGVTCGRFLAVEKPTAEAV